MPPMIRVLIVCVLIFSGSTSFATPTKTPVEIDAERVEVDQKKGQILFLGKVTVKRGQLILRCERLEARYEGNELIGLIARKDVEVRSKEFTARSKQARFTKKTGLLTLTGNPYLQRGKSQMRGERVLVWLDDEKVVIEKAKGRFDPALLKTLDKATQ